MSAPPHLAEKCPWQNLLWDENKLDPAVSTFWETTVVSMQELQKEEEG